MLNFLLTGNTVIPQNIFSNQMFCSLSVAETEEMEMNMAAMDSGSSGMNIDLTRKFVQADYPGGTRMVIVLPDKDVFKARKSAIYECAKACNNCNVSLVPLYYHSVTKENLIYLFSRPSVKYIYWCGHAGNYVGRDEKRGIPGVPRTNTHCWKIVDEDIIWDDYEQSGVFSYTRQTISSAPQLPSNWDNRGLDLRTIRLPNDFMYNTWNKKIVFVDGCNSGVPNLVNGSNDNAWSYGVFSDQGFGSLDQIYIGWNLPLVAHKDRFVEWFAGDTTEGVRLFWEQMGIQGRSVYDAFHYIDQFGSPQAQQTMFGDIGAIFDNGTGDDNIRIYGHGGGSRLDYITLNNN